MPCKLPQSPIPLVVNPCCNHLLFGVVPALVKAMRRRDFIKGIAGSATAGPLVARAQQPALPVVGFLSGGQSESWTPSSPLGAAFRGGLAEAGFVEGKTFAFQDRWAEGQFDRLPSLAADLVTRGPAVIVTHSRVYDQNH